MGQGTDAETDLFDVVELDLFDLWSFFHMVWVKIKRVISGVDALT